MGNMEDLRSHALEAAVAQPLTEELLSASGISPGMRVLVLGRDLGNLGSLAFLVAERVGRGGAVIAANLGQRDAAAARRRAAEECFGWVHFRAESLEHIALETAVDAVVGRFFLASLDNPVRGIRLATSMLREGGHVVFQEWHYGSILWPETSGWPTQPLYDLFARLTVEGLRRCGTHVDMGLRLANAFVQAGLSTPSLRFDLRPIPEAGWLEYAFLEDTLRELLPAIERDGLAQAVDVGVDTFAQRLQRDVAQAKGHAFLPLQVGAWTTLARRPRKNSATSSA